MKKKIIIAGATGFIGKRLANRFFSISYDISIITRDKEKSQKLFPDFKHIDWNLSADEFVREIDGSYGIINLAGASLAGKRWTESYKKIIIDSRVKTTERLVSAIKNCENKPNFLINASAIGFYGNRNDEILTENSEKGQGFLSDVCFLWEESAKPAKEYTRLIIPRIGIVLDKFEGALPKIMLPYKLFVGGNLGSGKDWLSWIHIDDLVNLFVWCIENENVDDIINCVSPSPVKKNDFNKLLGKALNRPHWLGVPKFALKMILGDAAEMLLSSQRVIPEKAQNLGFIFEYDETDYTLFSIIKGKFIKFV